MQKRADSEREVDAGSDYDKEASRERAKRTEKREKRRGGDPGGKVHLGVNVAAREKTVTTAALLWTLTLWILWR